MLKLARTKGQRLIIGQDPLKIILEHFGYSKNENGAVEIQLGITAPDNLDISTKFAENNKSLQQKNFNDRRQGKKLLISRCLGDTLLISENISVTLSEVASDKVFFAVDAPRHIRILREELL